MFKCGLLEKIDSKLEENLYLNLFLNKFAHEENENHRVPTQEHTHKTPEPET